MESSWLLGRRLLRQLKPQVEQKKSLKKDLMKNYILSREKKNKKIFFPRGERRKERERKKRAFLRGMILLIQSPRLFKWEERIFHLGPRKNERTNEKGRLLRLK